jgi:hypothetical protein
MRDGRADEYISRYDEKIWREIIEDKRMTNK